MRLGDQLVTIRQNLLSIARHHRGPRRRELIRAFFGTQARLARHSGAPRPGRARLLGYDIAYFSEEAFAILLSEVFVEPYYYLELASPRPVIVDGGANIGMSVLLWKYLYPDSEILAFEPDPDTFALLERNVSANGLSNVRVVNRALSDVAGPIDFFYNPDTPGNLGMGTLADPALKGRRTVEAAALSSYLTRPVDLLKLDVEGAEDAVVGELAKSGKLRSIEQVVMEYHHHMHGDDRLGGMLRTLETHGFGYQLDARPHLPFRKHEFTPMFLYAYRRPGPGLGPSPA